MNDKPFDSLRDLLLTIASYLPTLLAGLLVMLLGILAAWAASRVLIRLLIFMRLDRVFARLRWTDLLQSGDARHSLFEFIGALVGVFVFLVFFANALVIWRLTVLSEILGRFVALIPELITAGLILLVGWGVAVGVSRSVQFTLQQEGVPRSRLAGHLIRWGILVTTVVITLVELHIAERLVTDAFLIVLAAMTLTLVIAVGFGSQRFVATLWSTRLGEAGHEQDGSRDG